jgi:hypothetical protein
MTFKEFKQITDKEKYEFPITRFLQRKDTKNIKTFWGAGGRLLTDFRFSHSVLESHPH